MCVDDESGPSNRTIPICVLMMNQQRDSQKQRIASFVEAKVSCLGYLWYNIKKGLSNKTSHRVILVKHEVQIIP